jgi:hypothetical protein
MGTQPCVTRAAQLISFTPRETSTHGPDALRASPYSGRESASHARQEELPSASPCTHFPLPISSAGPFRGRYGTRVLPVLVEDWPCGDT